MKDRVYVLVAGSNGEHCSTRAYELARRVGRLLAERGCVTVTGGGGGVMEAACRGAKEADGLTVGILPGRDRRAANPFCDVVICTGLGWARNQINTLTADGVIVIEGGCGTLAELSYAYAEAKPIVALKGSGGIADEVAEKYLDDRRIVKVHGADSPEEAVELLLRLIKESGS